MTLQHWVTGTRRFVRTCMLMFKVRNGRNEPDHIQGVPGGMDKIRESVPYVKIYQYNPKHLYPKLNGYGDNGHRKVWASAGSTF